VGQDGRRECRDQDPDRHWMRLTWSAHSSSCLYLGTFEHYYHMKVEDFNDLYELMPLKEDARAGKYCCLSESSKFDLYNAGNASKMGAIEGKVKLAMCLRILFGEAPKSLAQLFRVCLGSVTDAFHLFFEKIGNCEELDFGVKVPNTEELQLRAFEFSKKSAHPAIFMHCVEAIDGLLIRMECPKYELDQRNFYSGHKLNYGLNLQASCDAQCKFVNASMCCAGSANDINAFNASHLPALYAQYPFFHRR